MQKKKKRRETRKTLAPPRRQRCRRHVAKIDRCAHEYGSRQNALLCAFAVTCARLQRPGSAARVRSYCLSMIHATCFRRRISTFV